MLRVDRKDISAIYLFAILAGLVQLSLPLGIQTIISFVLAGSLSASIVILIVLVVTGTFLNGLLQVRQLQLIEKLKQKIFVRFSLEFADRLPALNVEKLDHVHLPEMVNRFFEVPSFQKGIEKILLDIPTALIQMVLGLVLLSFYHPVFIAFGAVLLLIIIIILRYTVQPGFSASLEASDYKYRVAAWLQEIARMIKSFKYARNSAIHIRKTDDMVMGYLNARTHYFKILLTQAWALISFKTIITAAMLIVGATLLVDQQINIGQFIAADIVILAIIGSVEKLIGNLDVVYETFTSIEKMNAVIEAEKEKEGSLLLANQDTGVAVTFENVSFNYSNDEPILKNISCTIQPGELVLLKGPSGSGKSSFLRLLTAAFNSFDGNVLIDGLPIGNYQLESLRAKTGVLIHQQDIFRGTLLENITMGNPSISLVAVQEISTKTGLSPFIQSNKEGYDTDLDPLGKRLPQNIRQLILLNNVLTYIKNKKQATTILISEEENTASFDKVIELKEGSIQL